MGNQQVDLTMVSVLMITYNHELYIEQAIEGVLMQQTSFTFELIIGEDCSTDQTRMICKKFKEKYPDKIRLLLPNENLGMNRNFIVTLEQCTGKYIALCEGDDYWTDSLKLQKQVEFLEENTDYSMVFTNSMEVFNYNQWKKDSQLFSKVDNRDYSGSELLLNWSVPTVSVLFRNYDSFKLEIGSNILFGDILLYLYLSNFGKIRGLSDITSVYRRHDNSATNQHISYVKYLLHLYALNMAFKNKYKHEIKYLIAIEYYKQAHFYYKKRSIKVFYYTFLSMYKNSSVLKLNFIRKFRSVFNVQNNV